MEDRNIPTPHPCAACASPHDELNAACNLYRPSTTTHLQTSNLVQRLLSIMPFSTRCCSTRKLQIVVMLFMSTILLSSFALVTSLNIKSIPCLRSSSSFSSLNGRDHIRRSSRSTTLTASIDDKISEKKFYGFRSVAGQGVPTGAQMDPLSAPSPSSSSIPQIVASTSSAPISPILTIPSSLTSVTSSGFKDIPPISSTASPSLDSTLTFSNQPKNEATFTLLDRLKRMNTKFKLVQQLKTTTWDSPRSVYQYFLSIVSKKNSIKELYI